MPKPLACPQCDRIIDRRDLLDGECPFCNTDIGVADSFRRSMGLLTFALMGLVAFATHTPESDGTWLLFVILSGIPIWLALVLAFPPWLRLGQNQPKITVATSWMSAAVTMFVVEFLIFGGAHVVFGASQRDLREHLAMLSVPLMWIDPKFLITPEKSFTHACGVILGNSLFLGLVFYTCYQGVRTAFRRGRPTRLSIGNINSTEDDE